MNKPIVKCRICGEPTVASGQPINNPNYDVCNTCYKKAIRNSGLSSYLNHTGVEEK